MIPALQVPPCLPQIIPISGANYSVAKEVKAIFGVRDTKETSLYHLWMNCLYNESITIEEFFQELGTLLPSHAQRPVLNPKHILINGILRPDRSIQLAGSCYILLENITPYASPNFDYDILERKIHMIKVDTVPNDMLKVGKGSLVFTRAFYSSLKNINVELLRKNLEPFFGWMKIEPKSSQGSIRSLSEDTDMESGDFKSPDTQDSDNPVSLPQANRVPKVIVVEQIRDKSCSPNQNDVPDVKKQEKLETIQQNDPHMPNQTSTFNNLGDFIPITNETISSALDLISQFEHENRYIAFIIDDCFTNLSLDLIKVKYEPFFGPIKSRCVYLNSNQTTLLKTENEAKNTKIKALNRGFIIGAKNSNLDKNIGLKMKSRGIFSGDVTLESVIIALNCGKSLIVKNSIPKSNPKLLQSSRKRSNESLKSESVMDDHEDDPDTASKAKLVSTTSTKSLEKVSSRLRMDAQFNSSVSNENISISVKNVQKSDKEVKAKNKVDESKKSTQSAKQLHARSRIFRNKAIELDNNKTKSGSTLAKNNNKSIKNGTTKKYIQSQPVIIKNNQNIVNQSKKSKPHDNNSSQPSVQITKKELKSLTARLDSQSLERVLLNMTEDTNKTNNFVKDQMNQLSKFGDMVIRIDLLPPDLTVDMFNVMFGTYSLKSNQIIGVESLINVKGGRPRINVRVVIKSNNKDAQRILSKNGWKIGHKCNLLIRQTNMKELEQFLIKIYSGNAKRKYLPTSDGLLSAETISYSEKPYNHIEGNAATLIDQFL